MFRMRKDNKDGRIWTPANIVRLMLDFGGYDGVGVLRKHVIDNSCGNGAFLSQIVARYCEAYFKRFPGDVEGCQQELETYIHGIEINSDDCAECRERLDALAYSFGIEDGVKWDIECGDTLTVNQFDGKMDYVFGNPPYIRVHNLNDRYSAIKNFDFASQGMTDIYLVFYEIGFKMLADRGTMCLITPSSWFGSVAGRKLRTYIRTTKMLSDVIDLEQNKVFNATTWTAIGKFQKGVEYNTVGYYTYSERKYGLSEAVFNERLSYEDFDIKGNFHFADKKSCGLIRKIAEFECDNTKAVKVRNGLSTQADEVFISNGSPLQITWGYLPIYKASNGIPKRIIFPYDAWMQPIPFSEFERLDNERNGGKLSQHLLQYKDLLASRQPEGKRDEFWHTYGRTQGLNDVPLRKIAVNNLFKDKESIKIQKLVPYFCVYSGYYITASNLTDEDEEKIQNILQTDEFINYVKALKHYKNGGFYYIRAKEMEEYINYKLSV